MIHPTAIVDPKAELASDVSVGAYSVIGAGVKIDSGTEIAAHVVIEGPTQIGKNNKIFQFAALGAACQDLKYADEPTELIIGDNNTIREYATMHRGTVQDNGVTKVGSNNLFMAYTHIAHDCVIGDHNIFANLAQLAGHVKVGNRVILGGNTIVHQFVQFGDHSMTGMGSIVFKDVPAYVLCQGNPAKAVTINAEGLKRRGFSAAEISSLKKAYKIIYRKGLTNDQAIAVLSELEHQDKVNSMILSLQTSTRGIIR